MDEPRENGISLLIDAIENEQANMSHAAEKSGWIEVRMTSEQMVEALLRLKGLD